MEYNIYCDESCYLEKDNSKYMSIGGVWCPKDKIREVNERIKEIKKKYGYPTNKELKWTLISKANYSMYLDLINFFFDYKFINFRIIIIDKSTLNHKKYNQTHDDFYYKMYFLLLSYIFERDNSYNVYVDIKDTHSYQKCLKLQNVCCNDKWDFHHEMIKKIQPVRSEEINIIQLTDVLIGAVTYYNRYIEDFRGRSESKQNLIKKIKERSQCRLTKTTYLLEKKFNIFFWEGNNYEY